jgi:bis(5'-nucleosyl)-tetraphosphatase (symmetrical)
VRTIGFAPERDRLRFVGDLVNRGPDNLAVLRFVKSLGASAETVLGNHDLHLIARADGVSPEKELDTLDDVLQAKDRTELVEWLARRPLVLSEEGRLFVHAGLLPTWTAADALAQSRRLELALRDPRERRRIIGQEGSDPALKALTSIRTVKADGTLCKYSGAPKGAPPGCKPWFEHEGRKTRGTTVIFGHWSALGFRQGKDFVALDSGCVWGESLTALRLDDGQVFSERCIDPLGARE